MSAFAPYRGDPRTYRVLVTTDPNRHPWRRHGWLPSQIAQAQQQERAWLAAQQQRLRGAGDVVARMTSAVGIKPCAPCKQRQEKLNRWWPFS